MLDRLGVAAQTPCAVIVVDVDYVNLGHSDLRISRIGLGMLSFGVNPERPWVLDEESAAPIVRRALEGGINFFDTAASYNHGQSEVVTGRLLKKFVARENVIVATKVLMPTSPGEPTHLSGENIRASIDQSLRRLAMDYVDLYQVHRFDPLTPVDETMGALNELVLAGKVRWIGASSMYAWQFQKSQFAAERAGQSQFVSMQDHYNLIYREEEREMIPLCLDQGVSVIPWSPLARGILAGNRSVLGAALTPRARTDTFPDGRYEHPGDLDVIERLSEVAAHHGVPSAQIALAWLLHQPAVAAPIIGATRLQHVIDALDAVALRLDGHERVWLEAPYQPHAVHGH